MKHPRNYPWFRIGAASICAITLAGCGTTQAGPESSASAPASAAASTAASEEAPATDGSESVFYLNAQSTDSFWRAAGDGAKAAAEASGATFQELDANNDAAAQASQIDTAVSQGADVIVISPVDSKAVIPQLTAAQDADITVVAINRPISDMKLDGTVAMSEYEGGAAAAREMLSIALEQGLDSLNVLQLRGAASDEAAQLRGSGFSDTLTAEAGDVDVKLTQKGTEWDLDKAANAAEDVLSTQEVDAIYAESDYLMSALTPVLERNGYTKTGGDNHAILVGVGGLPDGLSLIREGWQDATMNFPIDRQAAAAVYMGLALSDGEEVQAAFDKAVAGAALDPALTSLKDDAKSGPMIGMVPQLVTSENAGDATLWGNKG